MVATLCFLIGQASGSIPPDASKLVKLVDKATASQEGLQWFKKKGGKWLAMKDAAGHLENDMWPTDVSLVASYLSKPKQFTYVELTSSSPSGDWMETTMHYFHPTGQLACVKISYQRIDYGGHMLTRWFDKAGTQKALRNEYFAGSGEPDNSASAKARAKEFGLSKKTFVKSASALPFRSLIK